MGQCPTPTAIFSLKSIHHTMKHKKRWVGRYNPPYTERQDPRDFGNPGGLLGKRKSQPDLLSLNKGDGLLNVFPGTNSVAFQTSSLPAARESPGS